MSGIKESLRLFIPPIYKVIRRRISKKRSNRISWIGDYSSWDDALNHCDGYDKNEILEKCKMALLKVKNGEAIYERDSVLFSSKVYSWPVLAGLQRAAIGNDKKLCVLDFGGSLGSSYFQNRDFLAELDELVWCIVEQPHFVACGRESFEDEELKFFYTLEECIERYRPDVVLFSSVLQYLPNPYEVLGKVLKLRCKYIILDITTFIDLNSERITVQKVPPFIYDASYPCWFFNKEKLQGVLGGSNYSILAEWRAPHSINIGYHGGLMFKQNEI